MSDEEDKPNIDSKVIAADGAIRIVQENEDGDAERKAHDNFGDDIGGNVSSAMKSSADTKHKDSSANNDSIPVLPQIYEMALSKQILDSTSSALRKRIYLLTPITRHLLRTRAHLLS